MDFHPWRAAILLGLLAIVGGMLWSMCLAPHHSHWVVPADAWTGLKAAHYPASGTFPLIYETGTIRDVFDGGPLLPLVLAPVALLGDVFHLTESYPLPVRRPTIWPIFGPYALASAIPLLYAARSLATQLGIRRGRLQLQCAVLLLAFVPMAIVYGHYEDVIALALVMLALRELFAGQGLTGALYLGIAIAFKQWAVLAVPVYVVACPPAIRVRALLASTIPPAALMSFFLAADYKYASRALFHPPIFPSLGHAALWVSPSTEYMRAAPSRFIVVGLALLVAWVIRHDPTPTAVLSALACVLLSRVFCEPVVHAYYLAPAIVFVLLAQQRTRDVALAAALSAALLLAFPFHPNRWVWWAVMLMLSVAIARHPVRQLARHQRGDDHWTGIRSRAGPAALPSR